jgi:ribosomal protein L40E
VEKAIARIHRKQSTPTPSGVSTARQSALLPLLRRSAVRAPPRPAKSCPDASRNVRRQLLTWILCAFAACDKCTFVNPWPATSCTMCGSGSRDHGRRVMPGRDKPPSPKGGPSKAPPPRRGRSKSKTAPSDVTFRPPAVAQKLWDGGMPLYDLVIEAVSEAGEVTEIKAHRYFLAAVSNVFKEKLYGDDAPKKPSSGPARLRLEGVDVEALRECVQWCYIESWSKRPELVFRCKRTARLFDVPGLEKSCCDSVREVLTPSAALLALDEAVEANDAELVTACIEGASREAATVVSSPEFLGLSARSVEVLCSCNTFAVDEEDLIKAVINWADEKALSKGGKTRAVGRQAASGAGATGGSAWTGPRCVPAALREQLCPGIDEHSPAGRVSVAPDESAASAASASSAAVADDGSSAFEYESGIGGSEVASALAETVSHPVNILRRLRFPLLKRDALVKVVRPSGILSSGDFALLVAHSFKPAVERRALKEVAGFSNVAREGTNRTLLIHMWGGGGATGQDSGPQYGGAGGYICVRYSLARDDELLVYVGDGGYADASGPNDAVSTLAWPNGGGGGVNWVSGGGGGATYITASLHDHQVVAGAGGGGGSPANGSWSSGGGGGGGTHDGVAGKGGNCGNQARHEPIKGENGGGDGGAGDTGGSSSNGKNAHGAGGGKGGSARANGGDGGESSCKWAEEVTKVCATDFKPVRCESLGVEAGGGGKPSAPRSRGEPGKCIIEIVETGEKFEFGFKGKPQKFEYDW